MNNLFIRRLKIASRCPQFFLKKIQRRIFGIDASWLDRSRDDFQIGSWEWLALTESHYGGFKVGSATGENRGGDRMSPFFHGYGETYAEFLKPFLAQRKERITLVEVGILNGSGLAIWCDLFPNARVIGLDLDLRNFNKNRAFLESQGAFESNKPELFEFDQMDLARAQTVLQSVLGNCKIDIAIDDGCHSIESIEITLKAMLPHMANAFVYFIEDNFDTFDGLAQKQPSYHWCQQGEIVVFKN